jgi:mitochondrial fission protein ELM1
LYEDVARAAASQVKNDGLRVISMTTSLPPNYGLSAIDEFDRRPQSVVDPSVHKPSSGVSVPRVWVLLADRAGGNGQLISLAKALGWPYEAKTIAYNWLNRCPNLLLGATLASVQQQRSNSLEPPWPDLVVGASRRSAPVARWIRRQSAGHTKLVHLLHTMAPLACFDLVITMPQYRLPARPNVLQLVAPLNRAASGRVAQSVAHWGPRLEHLPRPWIALLVGGSSATYRFGIATAERLGQVASARVRASRGTLLVTTSPRTSDSEVDALFRALDCSAFSYRWRPNDPQNPYYAFLSLADCFIVTADSASMLVEACLTGKPVETFDCPVRRRPMLRFKRWLWRSRRDVGEADAPRPAEEGRLLDRLVEWGIVKPPRDFEALHRALQDRGLLARLGKFAAPVPLPLDDMDRAVSAVHRLVGASSSAEEL